MSGDRKFKRNKGYIILSAIIFAVGMMMCVEGIFAIRSGRIIAGSARMRQMTGEEAVICGVLVMGLGGWVLRQVCRGKWH